MSTTLGIQAGVTTGSSLSGGSGSLPNDPIGTLDLYPDEIFGGYSTRRLKGVFPKLLPADYSGARAAYSLRKVRSGYPQSLPAEYGGGAAAAYSLRRVNGLYNGSAINVRRSSDDATKDIGFSDIGGLDTTALLAFVNEDVDIYTSDFTSGNEDMAEVNGTGADGQTIGGVSDAYKFTLSGGAVAHYTRTDSSFDRVNSYDVSFDYYIPSGQTINGIRVRTGTTGDGEYDQTTLDAWTSVAIENWTPTSKSTCRFNALVGSSIDPIDADGDVFYLKNIVITQTTADGHVTTWYDQSGNGNSATNLTASQQPLIVDGGTLVEENSKAAIQFDGVNDTLLSSTSFAQPYTAFAVRKFDSGADQILISHDTSTFHGVEFRFVATTRLSNGTYLNHSVSPTTTQGLLYALGNGSNSEISIDGGTTTTGNSGSAGASELSIGGRSSYYFNGALQEIIYFDSDQSDNRPFIEENINVYYDIYAQDEWDKQSAIKVRRSSDNALQDIGFKGDDLDTQALLAFVNEDYDHYTSDWSGDVDGWTVNNAGGGTVTLSNDTNRLKVDVSGMTTTALRPALNFPATIWSNITEGCSATITIEGSNLVVDGLFVDGTFQNITDYDLDTGTFTYTFTKAASNTAIIYFNSTGKGDYIGFLESVVVTQTTADGHVTTWYDQSGFGNHATNGSASQQPLVVSAGSVVTENGKAAIDFDGVDDYFTLGGTNDAGMLGDISVFSVNKNSISGNSVVVSTGTMVSSYAPNMQWGITGAVGGYTGTTSDGTTRINESISTSDYGSQMLVSMINNEDGNLQVFADGVGSTGQTAVAPMNDANFALEVGRDSGGQRYYFDGTQQELILFASDQSTNRQDIEWNINNHYSIYEQWNRNSAMSVRRSSDDTTKQIGFDGSSNMSEAEVLSFVNEAGPVLDDYTGAVSAYSLRKVRTAYTGSAIKVRRSSDDALQDIGFDSNGDLDTTALLAFVNADYNLYTSDFTSGNEDLTESLGTGADGQSVAGVDDAYKFTLSGGSSANHYAQRNGTLILDYGNRVTFDYYIPSTNTAVDGVMMRTGAIGDGEYNQTTLDAWTTATINFTPSGNANLRFNATDGGSRTVDADGDVFYLKNIVVTQTTADGAVTTWYDQSGSNDATNSTESEQPLVVSAGTLVEENGKAAIQFDGVDDQFDISVGITSGFGIFGVYKNTKANSYLIGDSPELGRRSNDQYRFRDGVGFSAGANGGTHSDNQVLIAGTEDGANARVYANGVEQASVASTFASATLIQIGKNFPDGTFQEVIIFNSDQSANRTGIEGNIGRYYNIDGFRDGFVTKWYDQSNNNNHLENASASQQPKIVEGGVMITENGSPAIEFNRTGEDEVLSAAASFAQPVTHFFVRRMPDLGGSTQVPLSYASGSSTPWGEVYLSGGQFRMHFGTYLGTFEGVEDLLLQYVLADGADSTIAYNGAEGETGNAGTQSISELHVGRNSNAGSHEAHVKAQELIVYQRDASAIREKIEEIINRHYRIYL